MTTRKSTKAPIHIEFESSDKASWVLCCDELAGPFESTAKAEAALKLHGLEEYTYRIVAIKRTAIKLAPAPVVARMTFA